MQQLDDLKARILAEKCDPLPAICFTCDATMVAHAAVSVGHTLSVMLLVHYFIWLWVLLFLTILVLLQFLLTLCSHHLACAGVRGID